MAAVNPLGCRPERRPVFGMKLDELVGPPSRRL